MRISVRVRFELRDLWVGLYWDTSRVQCRSAGGWFVSRELRLFFCLLPTLPLLVVLRFDGRS